MGMIDKIVEELVNLYSNGIRLLKDGLKEDVNFPSFTVDYEIWYTKALNAVQTIIPERTADFKIAYNNERRKEITPATYTISDYLMNIVINRCGSSLFDTKRVFELNMTKQLGIVHAASDSANSVLMNIKTTLQTELLDSDLNAARDLMKAGYLRASGVICGVVLESHLGSVANRHAIAFRKKNLTISDYNDALKDGNIYDVPTWRYIQRLGDIRNICGHAKDREPSSSEVDDLLLGTDKIIKEVF